MKPTNLLLSLLILLLLSCKQIIDNTPPNLILIMTDDQGWGQTGFYNHPVLKTPNLDAMAENGIRFDRFYAAAPVCSPTRASILTGRSNDRTGVTEKHVHRRIFDDRIDLTFYVDAGLYQPIKFFEEWIAWITNGRQISDRDNERQLMTENYFYRISLQR